MDIVAHLQKLKDLIVEQTKPPVTAMLLNQLSLITEQAEAYQASSDKQDQTLATQINKIEQLMAENAQLKALAAKPKLHFAQRLYWQDRDEIPFCPYCWESRSKRIHLSGPESVFDNPGAEIWQCTACRTEYFAASSDSDFIGSGPK